MHDSIRAFFNRNRPAGPTPAGPTPPAASDSRSLKIAACALLLEVAHADDEFTVGEQGHIEESLARLFDVPEQEVSELIALAEQERRGATDLFQFTAVINESYDEGQRMALAEVLWRVVFADGQLSAHESYLMRKISNLLDLRPGYLAEARKRAGGGPPA
jgi:uncharacterized tellurite resistance protein B-like protein